MLSLALIVFLAFATQSLSGFGGALVALSVGAHFFALEDLLPIFVPLSLATTGAIVLRERAHVDRSLLFRRILPFMGVGLAAGVAFFAWADGALLKRIFGALVMGLAGRELARPLEFAEASPTSFGAPRVSALWLVAAGLVHGIYATGGPLLVYSLGRAGLGRSAFRGTLAAVWLALNAALTATYLAAGRLGPAVLPKIGALAPVAAAAIAAGEWAHRRTDERRFRTIVFGLLLLSGAGILFRF
jgi:uncharacterized membrane protein YfcA